MILLKYELEFLYAELEDVKNAKKYVLKDDKTHYFVEKKFINHIGLKMRSNNFLSNKVK